MPAYAYYQAERARHQDALKTALTEEQVLAAVASLCSGRGLPPIETRFHFKKGARSSRSWYQPQSKTWRRDRRTGAVTYGKEKKEHFSFSTNMCNVLTVAHEVAHAVTWHRYLAKKAAGIPCHNSWHDGEHRLVTDELVAVLGKMVAPAVVAAPPEVVAAAKPVPKVKAAKPRGADLQALVAAAVAAVGTNVEAVIAHVAQAFLQTQALTKSCPRCACVKPREAFGTRCVDKDSQGLPVKMLMQSHCRECRKMK